MKKMASNVFISQVVAGIACVGCFTHATGASAEELPAALTALQIDHASISVQDLEVEAAWYVRAFGLKETSRNERPTMSVRNYQNAGLRIDLIKYPGSSRTPASPVYKTQGWVHLALTSPDVPATKAALMERNIEVKGTNVLTLTDPEGNEIEIFPRK